MSRGTPRRVLRRRASRAASALAVVAVTALGQSGGSSGFEASSHVQAIGRVVEPTPVALVEPVAPGVPGDDASSVPTPEQPTVAAVPTVTATAVSPAAPTGSGIPSTVLAAYRAAEATLAGANPNCHVSWSLIAGIGRVESGHASGGRVDASGTTNGRILGPRLDGSASTAVIRDTDGGSLDSDTAYDRAVGPMQFIPGTWKAFAKDGNKDGVANPHNVYDAALAAGTYLCSGGGDLAQPAAQRAALLRYNRSDAYATLVLRWAGAYAAGASALPDQTGQVPTTTPTPPTQVPAPAASTAAAAAASTTSSSASTTTTTTTTTTTAKPTTTTATTTKPTTAPPTTTSKPTTTTPATSTTTKPVETSTTTTTNTTTSEDEETTSAAEGTSSAGEEGTSTAGEEGTSSEAAEVVVTKDEDAVLTPNAP